MKNILLFLDMDGVLNSNNYIWSEKTRDTCGEDFDHIDTSRVAIVNKLVDILDCKVMISSAWRILLICQILDLGCFIKAPHLPNESFDKTDSKGPIRGSEIARRLERYPDHHLCILDDNTDMGHLLPYLVKTNPDTGIVESDIDKAIEIIAMQRVSNLEDPCG